MKKQVGNINGKRYPGNKNQEMKYEYNLQIICDLNQCSRAPLNVVLKTDFYC